MNVALEHVAFAPDDEREFAMRLQPDHAVDDVDARLFESSRPFDVALLVEPRFEFDEHADLFALLARLNQRFHNGRMPPRAIEAHFDGEHVGVFSRGRNETRHRVVRGERMMKQNVAFFDGIENCLLRVTERRGNGGLERPVFEGGQVESVELHHVGDVERPINDVHVIRRQIERGGQKLNHLGRHRCRHFQSHRQTEATAMQMLLHRPQEVARFILANLEISVARHAEQVALAKAHVGEKRGGVGCNQASEKSEVAA